jgi:hypothetical protein
MIIDNNNIYISNISFCFVGMISQEKSFIIKYEVFGTPRIENCLMRLKEEVDEGKRREEHVK